MTLTAMMLLVMVRIKKVLCKKIGKVKSKTIKMAVRMVCKMMGKYKAFFAHTLLG